MTLPPRPPSDTDPLLLRVRSAIGRERGPRAALRALQTPLRVATGLLGALVVAGLVLAAAPRSDLGSGAAGAWTLEAALLVAAAAAALATLFRPLGRPAPGALRVALALAAALALPVVLGLLAPAGVLYAGSGARRAVQGVALPALSCFGLGLLFALPLTLLAALASRRTSRRPCGRSSSRRRAGRAGNLALLLHCPCTEPVHLLLGHATVVLGWLAVLGLLARTRVRARPR